MGIQVSLDIFDSVDLLTGLFGHGRFLFLRVCVFDLLTGLFDWCLLVCIGLFDLSTGLFEVLKSSRLVSFCVCRSLLTKCVDSGSGSASTVPLLLGRAGV